MFMTCSKAQLQPSSSAQTSRSAALPAGRRSLHASRARRWSCVASARRSEVMRRWECIRPAACRSATSGPTAPTRLPVRSLSQERYFTLPRHGALPHRSRSTGHRLRSRIRSPNRRSTIRPGHRATNIAVFLRNALPFDSAGRKPVTSIESGTRRLPLGQRVVAPFLLSQANSAPLGRHLPP